MKQPRELKQRNIQNQSNNMTRREELIELTGQALNGMLSADDSVLTKILDRTVHRQVAETAVGIAVDTLRRIDEIEKQNDEQI